MASLKWVKLTTGFYKDAKIKKVLRTAGGDRVVFFWVLLLALAGELNHSGYLEDDDDVYTCEMLADETDFRPSFVRKSIQILIEKGLLNRTEDGVLYIPNWDKHQSEEKLEQRREKERLKKQRQRARKREKLLNVPGDVPPDIPTQNKKENQNQNESIIMNNNNPTFSYVEPTQPIPMGGDGGILTPSQPYNPTTNDQSTLPPALTQTVDAYCNELSARDTPPETHTMLLAWLSSLQEKNRLPTTGALPLILAKLPQAAKESRLSLPEYIQEVICRGWQSFYPLPTFGKSPSKKAGNPSYDIDELEAMI